MIKFNTQRKSFLSRSSVDQAKQVFLSTVGELLYTELFVATSSRGPESLGIKTGRLRQSLRVDISDDAVRVYFDPRVAEHAPYAVGGTRYIKSRGILERSLQNVIDSSAYMQARNKFMNALGFQNAPR